MKQRLSDAGVARLKGEKEEERREEEEETKERGAAERYQINAPIELLLLPTLVHRAWILRRPRLSSLQLLDSDSKYLNTPPLISPDLLSNPAYLGSLDIPPF